MALGGMWLQCKKKNDGQNTVNPGLDWVGEGWAGRNSHSRHEDKTEGEKEELAGKPALALGEGRAKKAKPPLPWQRRAGILPGGSEKTRN